MPEKLRVGVLASGGGTNLQTIIEYSLAEDCNVNIKIYNILGQKVRILVNEHQGKGLKRITWDGKSDNRETVSSGIYFYRIQTDNFNQTKKMVIVK